jgi:hypothetical protein
VKRHLEIEENLGEELFKRNSSVVDKDRLYLFAKVTEQGIDEGGLSGAHFPGDGNEASPLIDSINHGGKRLSMTGGEIEELGVRSQLKGFF